MKYKEFSRTTRQKVPCTCTNNGSQKDHVWRTTSSLVCLQYGVPNGKRSKMRQEGFPGGAVVGSLPASAGDTGSGPGLGGSHVPRSGWAREPQLLSLCIRSGRGRDSERPAHRDGEWPPLAATGESPRTETKTQHSHK